MTSGYSTEQYKREAFPSLQKVLVDVLLHNAPLSNNLFCDNILRLYFDKRSYEDHTVIPQLSHTTGCKPKPEQWNNPTAAFSSLEGQGHVGQVFNL